MGLKTLRIFFRLRGRDNLLEKLVTFKRYFELKIYKFLKKTVIKRMRGFEDVLFEINPGCSISEKMYIVGLYDSDTMNLLLQYMDEHDVFFDIGANVGPFCLIANTKTKNIFAFEGHPLTTERLKKNFVLNGISSERAHNRIVSNDEKEIVFTNIDGSAINKIIENDAKSTIKFKSTTISKLSDQLEVIPSFIKIDTEGHEWEVISGVRELFKLNKIDFISFEANGLSSRENLKKINILLKKCNFIVGSIDIDNKIIISKSDLGYKSKTGDYYAISDLLRKRLVNDGFVIKND